MNQQMQRGSYSPNWWRSWKPHTKRCLARLGRARWLICVSFVKNQGSHLQNLVLTCEISRSNMTILKMFWKTGRAHVLRLDFKAIQRRDTFIPCLSLPLKSLISYSNLLSFTKVVGQKPLARRIFTTFLSCKKAVFEAERQAAEAI